MNIEQYEDLFYKIYKELVFNYTTDTSSTTAPNVIENLDKIRELIIPLQDTSLFDEELAKLKSMQFFTADSKLGRFTSEELKTIRTTINLIKHGVEKYYQLIWAQKLSSKPNSIEIKLPAVGDFSDLGKVCNDLKLAIEQPINLLDGEAGIEITSVRNGSIWLTVSLGGSIAIALIGKICMAALNLRQKNAVAESYIEHSRSLKINNDILEHLKDKQKLLIDEYVDAVTKDLTSEFYSQSDKDKEDRIKVAIEKVADLYSRNAILLPVGNDLELKKQFPTNAEVALLMSPIKQIEKDGTN